MHFGEVFLGGDHVFAFYEVEPVKLDFHYNDDGLTHHAWVLPVGAQFARLPSGSFYWDEGSPVLLHEGEEVFPMVWFEHHHKELVWQTMPELPISTKRLEMEAKWQDICQAARDEIGDPVEMYMNNYSAKIGKVFMYISHNEGDGMREGGGTYYYEEEYTFSDAKRACNIEFDRQWSHIWHWTAAQAMPEHPTAKVWIEEHQTTLARQAAKAKIAELSVAFAEVMGELPVALVTPQLASTRCFPGGDFTIPYHVGMTKAEMESFIAQKQAERQASEAAAHEAYLAKREAQIAKERQAEAELASRQQAEYAQLVSKAQAAGLELIFNWGQPVPVKVKGKFLITGHGKGKITNPCLVMFAQDPRNMAIFGRPKPKLRNK